jgi:hypothetical protein
MKKTEAEPAIRSLVGQWAGVVGFDPASGKQPSFSAFTSWLAANGYSHYLDFRSVLGAHGDAEQWFDEELRQTWRN